MKLNKKKGMALILGIFMIITAIQPINVNAANTTNEKIKQLAKEVSIYMCLKNSAGEDKKTFKLKESEKYDILIIISSIPEYIADDYNLNGKTWEKPSSLKKACKKYFGTSKAIPYNKCQYVYRCSDGTLTAGGDWGDMYPAVKINKVKKVKSGVYDVSLTTYMGSLDTQTEHKVGTGVVRIKKSSKSSFGYIVTGIKYKSSHRYDH